MFAAFTDSFGSANVLEVRETAVPSLGEHDVLVEVHASPVTAGDRRLRAADFPGVAAVLGRLMVGVRRPRHPIQGSMVAGVVTKVGAKVRRYAVGDRVFGFADHGAYAEYVAVHEDAPMTKIPEQLGFDEAAALPYGLGTSLHFLDELAKVEAGESVLILGGSGGVGRYAIQVAKHLGAEVTVTASASKHELVRSLGADHVLDYRTQDLGDRRYDVIFDVADASSFAVSRSSLTPKGRYLSLFLSMGLLVRQALNGLRSQKALFALAMPDRAAYERMAKLAETGAIRPVIAERFELSEIASAHEVAEGRPQGDVIVEVASPLARRRSETRARAA